LATRCVSGESPSPRPSPREERGEGEESKRGEGADASPFQGSPPTLDLVWCAASPGVRLVIGRTFLEKFAVIGVLAVALALAGCGRKGGLDPPPGAEIQQRYDSEGKPLPDVTPEGRPIISAPKRRLPIDWLLD